MAYAIVGDNRETALIYVNQGGGDLRDLPLIERKRRLSKLIGKTRAVRRMESS